MNTLKGFFDTQKPIHRKNFIKENVRQLREMQICWQAGEERGRTVKGNRNSGPRVSIQDGHSKTKVQSNCARPLPKDRVTKSAPPKPISEVPNMASHKPVKPVLSGKKKNKSEEKIPGRGDTGDIKDTKHNQTSRTKLMSTSAGNTISDEENICPTESECSSRGCQTLDPSNMDNLYYEGVIKYPSSRKSPHRTKPNFKLVPTRDMALQTDDTEDAHYNRKISRNTVYLSSNSSAMGDMRSIEDSNSTGMKTIVDCGLRESSSEEELDEDYTKTQNKNKHSAGSTITVNYDQLKAPPNYQKGVVPKYLRERREEWRKAAEQHEHDSHDPCCPPGHVPLPEHDRKDTLKMLRKSHADLVVKLNMLPVRSDSLKTRQTKIQLEEQLNKVEDGIKVFSRPKVYVKVGD